MWFGVPGGVPECSLTYIGETGRMLATRMKDHLNLRNPLTAVGEHCAHEHHTITKDSVRVLAREDGWLKRKVREAIEIKIGQPAMNRDQGYELPPSTMNFCCHVIVVKTVTWPRRGRHFGLKKGARCTRKLPSSKFKDSGR